MTPLTLTAIFGVKPSIATIWTEPINASMALWAIDSPARQAAFLAQVGHESGRLAFVKEIWGPTAAQLRYEGRADLGNTQVGDGKRFMGRGLLQTTGPAGYKRASQALGVDFVSTPGLLEMPQHAANSAAWFWNSHGLNELADKGDMESITRILNGGLNGLQDRLDLYHKAVQVLGIDSGTKV